MFTKLPRALTIAGVAALATMVAGTAHAQTTRFHEGEATVIEPQSDRNPLSEIISGLDFRQPEIREMQADDFANPGAVFVDLGEELWTKIEGSAGKSMSQVWKDCTGGLTAARAATSYPRYHKGAGKVINLEQQINYCRENAMGAKPYKWEKDEMLGMTAYIRTQGRGQPVKVDISGPAKAVFEKGEKLYNTRIGQLDMACAHCHNNNYGSYLRADMLSQGHSNGFPLYRLKWNGFGSLHRRIRGCNGNIRATKLAYGHEDYVALELYMAWRGQGLPVETPAVRQ